MDIITRYWNAYRFTYMGDWKLKVLNMNIEPGDVFVIPKKEAGGILNHFPESEIDNLIYEKVIHSAYRKKI